MVSGVQLQLDFLPTIAPAFARGYGDGVTYGANQIAGAGLFYGGGFSQLGLQLLGMLCTAAFTAVTITITFLVIKAIFGLRVFRKRKVIDADAASGMVFHLLMRILNHGYRNTMTMGKIKTTNLGVERYDRFCCAEGCRY